MGLRCGGEAPIRLGVTSPPCFNCPESGIIGVEVGWGELDASRWEEVPQGLGHGVNRRLSSGRSKSNVCMTDLLEDPAVFDGRNMNRWPASSVYKKKGQCITVVLFLYAAYCMLRTVK